MLVTLLNAALTLFATILAATEKLDPRTRALSARAKIAIGIAFASAITTVSVGIHQNRTSDITQGKAIFEVQFRTQQAMHAIDYWITALHFYNPESPDRVEPEYNIAMLKNASVEVVKTYTAFQTELSPNMRIALVNLQTSLDDAVGLGQELSSTRATAALVSIAEAVQGVCVLQDPAECSYGIPCDMASRFISEGSTLTRVLANAKKAID